MKNYHSRLAIPKLSFDSTLRCIITFTSEKKNHEIVKNSESCALRKETFLCCIIVRVQIDIAVFYHPPVVSDAG